MIRVDMVYIVRRNRKIFCKKIDRQTNGIPIRSGDEPERPKGTNSKSPPFHEF